MDLLGALLVGMVLVSGSIYAGWTAWTVFKEARASVRKAKADGPAVTPAIWIQHGLTLLGSLVFLGVALSLGSSIVQGDSFSEAFVQLNSINAPESAPPGLTWGEKGNQGTLHVSTARGGRTVTGASLTYIEFDNSDLQRLSDKYPQIRWFILSGTQVDDQGVAILARRQNLTALVVADTSVTDQGIAAFRSHPGLNELDLTRTAITDRGLESVASLASLKYLNLRETKVTAGGLRTLAGKQSLHTLNIQETCISGEGIDTLVTLQGLRMLYVSESWLTADRLERLHRALPSCEVTYTKY